MNFTNLGPDYLLGGVACYINCRKQPWTDLYKIEPRTIWAGIVIECSALLLFPIIKKIQPITTRFFTKNNSPVNEQELLTIRQVEENIPEAQINQASPKYKKIHACSYNLVLIGATITVTSLYHLIFNQPMVDNDDCLKLLCGKLYWN